MKKILSMGGIQRIAVLLIVVLMVGNMIPAQARTIISGSPLKNYYYQLYYDGKMKDPPSDIIGDATLNGTIDARDALLVLWLAVSPKVETQITDISLDRMEQICSNFYRYNYNDDTRRETYDYENDLAFSIATYYRHPLYQTYINHAYFLSDVSNDCTINAEDALLILQHAVGKIAVFPRTDYTGTDDFRYLVWPAEWYPTMYFDLREYLGEDAYAKIADDFPDIPPMKTE